MDSEQAGVTHRCEQFRDGKCVKCGALDPQRPVPPQYYPGAESPVWKEPRRGND